MSRHAPTILRRRWDQSARIHPDPLLNRIFAARGVSAASELDTRLRALLDPAALGGIDCAVATLRRAIDRGPIAVVGDYDADGATSTALAVDALRRCGAQVQFMVPNRFSEGYGLGAVQVDRAHGAGCCALLTVDNGIASVAAVERARALGLAVVVTDHHLPGDTLPAADAVVNPNCAGDRFAGKHTAGVGVVFYLMARLCRALRDSGHFSARGLSAPNPADWLDLVALGTVADVVRLDANNRILIEQGLRRIRAGRARPGIEALLAVAGRRAETATAADLGFALAPRLNAAGRLDDMGIGVDCLLAAERGRADALAARLDALNRERREIEAQMQQAAEELLARCDEQGAENAAICLFEPDWHQGVCGIIASRLKERHYRPALVFARAGEGELRGSGRSIPALHLRDLLAAIDAAQPGLISRFGGHAMAAGLSLPAANFTRFRRALLDAARAALPEPPQRCLYTDGELPPERFDRRTAHQLRYAAPWGAGFAEPSFEGEFAVLEQRVVGSRHLKLRLRPASAGAPALDAIAFGAAEAAGHAALRAVYRLDLNHWRGEDRLQLVLEHLEPA